MAYDLDAVAAESTDDPFVFVFGGKEYTVPSRGEVDYEVLNLLEDNDFKGSFRKLVGEDQWPDFSATTLRMKQVKALLKAWSSFKGDAEGESSDSSDS